MENQIQKKEQAQLMQVSPQSWQSTMQALPVKADQTPAEVVRMAAPALSQLNAGTDKSAWRRYRCPYGKPGDLLWVRERWAMVHDCPDLSVAGYYTDDHRQVALHSELKADGSVLWRPGIFMRKRDARIWLQVDDVRVERLHDITEEDAISEGIIKHLFGYRDYELSTARINVCVDGASPSRPIASFRSLWRSINGAESWDANPWLWVVKFKVLSTTGRPVIAEQEAAS